MALKLREPSLLLRTLAGSLLTFLALHAGAGTIHEKKQEMKH